MRFDVENQKIKLLSKNWYFTSNLLPRVMDEILTTKSFLLVGSYLKDTKDQIFNYKIAGKIIYGLMDREGNIFTLVYVSTLAELLGKVLGHSEGKPDLKEKEKITTLGEKECSEAIRFRIENRIPPYPIRLDKNTYILFALQGMLDVPTENLSEVISAFSEKFELDEEQVYQYIDHAQPDERLGILYDLPNKGKKKLQELFSMDLEDFEEDLEERFLAGEKTPTTTVPTIPSWVIAYKKFVRLWTNTAKKDKKATKKVFVALGYQKDPDLEKEENKKVLAANFRDAYEWAEDTGIGSKTELLERIASGDLAKVLEFFT